MPKLTPKKSDPLGAAKKDFHLRTLPRNYWKPELAVLEHLTKLLKAEHVYIIGYFKFVVNDFHLNFKVVVRVQAKVW